MKTRLSTEIKIIFALVIVLAFVAGAALVRITAEAAPVNERGNADVSAVDVDFSDKASYTLVTPQIDGTLLSLSSDCYALSFGITEDQAYSIYRGLGGIVESRPLTHDTIKDVFDDYDIVVKSARIDGKRDEIYTARLFLIQGTRVLDIDLRPSDATAIAVRTHIPVYVRTSILEDDGTNT